MYTKLIKHRLCGGVGYIDFYDYYSASILTQLKEWFLPSPTTVWGLIESSHSPHYSLSSWLFSAQLGAWVPSFIPSTIIITLRSWKWLLQQAQTYTNSTTLKIPLSALAPFIPKYPSHPGSKKG